MIDFNNNSVFKLKKTDASKFDAEMRDILIEGNASSVVIRTFGIMLSLPTRESSQ